MQIGYARVSTTEQNLDLQLDALRKAGCSDNNIFTDKITGTKQERPGLTNALSRLRSGDTFVVWRLDRLARSLSHLIETVNQLAGRGVAFWHLSLSLDQLGDRNGRDSEWTVKFLKIMRRDHSKSRADVCDPTI